MGCATRVFLIAGLALAVGAQAPAGPPGAGGHSLGGPISGPAPMGATGRPPVHASGSLTPGSYFGSGYRGGGNRAGYAPGRTGRGGNLYGGDRGDRGNRGDRGERGDRGDRRDYRHLPSALFFAPYYYPFLDYQSTPYDTGYDNYGGGPAGAQDPAVEAVFQSQDQLGQQVQRLTSEVEQLREQQYQGSPYVMNPPGPPESDQPQSAVPVTLVLRGGQTLKVQDYAVVNGVFWDFTKQPPHKISLSDVDIDASTKATQAAGGDFPDILVTAQQSN